MNIKSHVLSGAAGVALAGFLSVTPGFAHTSQPATPEEMQQTDALNAKALAAAQGAPTTVAAATPADATAPAAATPLNTLATVPILANAAVQDADGIAIGTVKDVIAGTDGRPAIVDVALADNSKIVALSAGELSYDQARNVLTASLTGEQIKALPAAGG